MYGWAMRFLIRSTNDMEVVLNITSLFSLSSGSSDRLNSKSIIARLVCILICELKMLTFSLRHALPQLRLQYTG